MHALTAGRASVTFATYASATPGRESPSRNQEHQRAAEQPQELDGEKSLLLDREFRHAE